MAQCKGPTKGNECWAMSVSYRQRSFPWGRWPGGRLFSTERRECFKKNRERRHEVVNHKKIDQVYLFP